MRAAAIDCKPATDGCEPLQLPRGSQKVAHETCYRCRVLDVRRMTGSLDDMDLGTGEAPRMPRSSPLPVHAFTAVAENALTAPPPLPRERVRCVPGMLNSSEVKVLCPT